MPIPTAPLADALMVPEKLKRGRTQLERIRSILVIAYPLLGVDQGAGERALIRRQPGGWLFVTKDPEDTIYHPLDSPLRGRDRYTWVLSPDGIKRGYLTSQSLPPRLDPQIAPPGTIKDTV